MKTPEQLARAKYTAYLRAQGRATKVPIEPVRDHLWKLHFVYGMSCAQLAKKCTLSEGSISEIIAGERRGDHGQIYRIKEIFRENAESVMAIEPEVPTDRGGARVNAIGTTRRIQGLAAEGFPIRWVGNQIGTTSQTFYLTAWGKREMVYYSTAWKIKTLYEKLENDLHPEAHGIDPGKAALARTYALRNGFVRPIFWDWDTIDDPDGFPDYTGACGTPQGSQAHRRKGILPVCQPCKDAVAAQRREQRGV
ncbi:helix-turn-helix DNA binding domain protein [Streptomyces phage LazerLemon]|nr:helix-turn-helix DNA binding domain protein [Streptomyces phage LazerLemon]